MISSVDAYRDKHGVEPICKVLPIAPSTYDAHVARRAKPETVPARVKREACLVPSVSSVGDSYDNALAETIYRLYKAEVIHRKGPWRSFEAVDYDTLEWVDRFNNRRLLKPIGNIPPAEAEAAYYASLEQPLRLAA